MKARIILGMTFLGLLAVAGSYCIAWVTKPTHRINRVSFGHIKQGMTKDKVEAILACSPGVYGRTPLLTTTEGTVLPVSELKSYLDHINASLLTNRLSYIWSGDEGAILVHFSNDHVVTHSSFWDAAPAEFLPSLRRWASCVAANRAKA